MKIPDLYKEFSDYAVLERCLEPTTIRWYNNSIKSFYKYLRRRVLPANLEALNVETLRDFLIHQRQLGNAPRTVLNYLRALRAFCTFLVRRNYLPSNPFDRIEKPKLSRKLPEFLDEEEARQLLRACMDMKRFYKSQGYRDVAIIAMFLLTGTRKKELLNLKLRDVNLERAYIKVAAKNKEQVTTAPPFRFLRWKVFTLQFEHIILDLLKNYENDTSEISGYPFGPRSSFVHSE